MSSIALTLACLLAFASEASAQERAATVSELASDSTALLETYDALACDPAYADVCIPPPPPDLDCADVPNRDFVVVGEDRHRFDGDADGIACEGE